MTCLEGYFQEPGDGVKSLAEIAVTTPAHGAVASWSPTGLGLVTGHDSLETGLFIALFHKGLPQLGAATVYAKQYLWDEAPDHRDLVDTFGLLGDPALEVKTEQVCLAPTAVTIADLAARSQRHGVQLVWSTPDEREILGFSILRREVTAAADVDAAGYALLTETPIFARNPGQGTGGHYSFGDATALPGVTYEYALEVLRLDGDRQQFGPVRATMGAPRRSLPPAAEK